LGWEEGIGLQSFAIVCSGLQWFAIDGEPDASQNHRKPSLNAAVGG
jgi:hypothetical protein